MPRQMMAIFKSGDRTAEVATITVPTLVLHGADDTLLQPVHGEYTASVIAGAELEIYEGMGHNIPDPVLPSLLARMVAHMQVSDSRERGLQAGVVAPQPAQTLRTGYKIL
jgi:hypothetical protein